MLEYLDDLEADFLAIYGERAMMGLESAKFFRLAERLPAFRGVLRARLQVEAEAGAQHQTTVRTASPGADHPAAQRVNLLSQGGAVATTTLAEPSYLHELLKQAPGRSSQ